MCYIANDIVWLGGLYNSMWHLMARLKKITSFMEHTYLLSSTWIYIYNITLISLKWQPLAKASIKIQSVIVSFLRHLAELPDVLKYIGNVHVIVYSKVGDDIRSFSAVIWVEHLWSTLLGQPDTSKNIFCGMLHFLYKMPFSHSINKCFSWGHNHMETFSVLLALCAGNTPATIEFPSQRPVIQSFDVFFDLCLNRRLSKQSNKVSLKMWYLL